MQIGYAILRGSTKSAARRRNERYEQLIYYRQFDESNIVKVLLKGYLVLVI